MNTSNNQRIRESKKNRNLRLGQLNLQNSNRATNESGQVMLEKKTGFLYDPRTIFNKWSSKRICIGNHKPDTQ